MLSSSLAATIEHYASELQKHPLFHLARRGQVTQKAVGTYLNGVLYLIRHTPIHLELSRERANQLGNANLERFLANKAREELGHDRWAEQDLERLGQPSLPATAESPCSALVELARYLEQEISRDPRRYVVYILFAEYLTILLGQEWICVLENHCGIPSAALSVVAQHAILDQEHVAEDLAEIDELLDPTDERSYDLVLTAVMGYFRRFVDDLLAQAQSDATALGASMRAA